MMAIDSVGTLIHEDEANFRLLSLIGMRLNVTVDDAETGVARDDGDSRVARLTRLARTSGIEIRELPFDAVNEALGFVEHGHPIIISDGDGDAFILVLGLDGGRFETISSDDQVETDHVTRRRLKKLVAKTPDARIFFAKKELECDSLAASPDGDHEADSHGPSPLRRFMALLDLDRRDILTVILFASVAGVLALATPLAVESLVNVVSWGTYLQPLVVLALMLVTCLALAGVLSVLQKIVVELIQRRQFVRIIGDLAHRFPRANRQQLAAEHPRELANRLFDIMTIQKASAVLLVDGVNIVLTTMIGMLLLAFYHPFLLGFDIVLLLAMISVTWLLGRGGVRSAISESITKYKVIHWLQDVLASPTAFKTGGGEMLAVRRASQLSADYVAARQAQFRVVIRQITFAIGLQAFALTALLGLGGWLVIQGQLTLGQLVASELVVTVVVGAFAKAGKSLEKFYDLMAGVEKVGHLLDLHVDSRQDVGQPPDGPAEVRWQDLKFDRTGTPCHMPAAVVEAGSRVALVGNDMDGRCDLVATVAGLVEPAQGTVEIAGYDATVAAAAEDGSIVGYAGPNRDFFRASLRDNVDLGRRDVGHDRIRQSLLNVGLWSDIQSLPDGLQTVMQSTGYPLSNSQRDLLILARAMAGAPRLLIVDRLLDQLSRSQLDHVWKSLAAPDAPWTLIVSTNRLEIAERCEAQLSVRN